MDTQFQDKILPIILRNEGVLYDKNGKIIDTGYVNNPNDSGGETNYGITQNTYDSSKQKHIKNITLGEVSSIYESEFWKACKCDIISEYDLALAINIFDCAVNSGPSIAIKLIQNILGITEDGIIGIVTLNTLRNSSNINLLFSLKRTWYYSHITIEHPRNREFLAGWIMRVYRTFYESKLAASL